MSFWEAKEAGVNSETRLSNDQFEISFLGSAFHKIKRFYRIVKESPLRFEI